MLPTRRVASVLAFAACALVPFFACKSSEPATETAHDGCALLFGNPNDQTGLGPDQCGPRCSCGDVAFVPPTYDEAFIHSLEVDWQLATPYASITTDPYAGPAPAAEPDGTVCAVLPNGNAKPRLYELVTYASADAARAAGAAVTHFGACGVCSTLANLAVYMRENDLTAPVRDCGLGASGQDAGDADVACLQRLGFDLPCAQVWAYNTAHTRKACLDVCLQNLGATYNVDGGALNPCLQCDEDQSGPVFKAVAGRTRRNSGLPNAICRPCSEVQPLVHAY